MSLQPIELRPRDDRSTTLHTRASVSSYFILFYLFFCLPFRSPYPLCYPANSVTVTDYSTEYGLSRGGRRMDSLNAGRQSLTLLSPPPPIELPVILLLLLLLLPDSIYSNV